MFDHEKDEAAALPAGGATTPAAPAATSAAVESDPSAMSASAFVGSATGPPGNGIAAGPAPSGSGRKWQLKTTANDRSEYGTASQIMQSGSKLP